MTTHPKPARVDLGDGDSLILFRTSDHHTTVRFHSANANTQLAGAVMETGALRAALDEVAPAGSYARAESPDLMDGGVTCAAIEDESIHPERARSLVQERDDARNMAHLWKETTRRAIRSLRTASLHRDMVLASLDSAIRAREEAERERARWQESAEAADRERHDWQVRAVKAEDRAGEYHDTIVALRTDLAIALDRAEKAEQERDDALLLAKVAAGQADDALGMVARGECHDCVRDAAVIEKMRPMRAEDVTGEMVGRLFRAAGQVVPGWGVSMDDCQYLLQVALTEPQRPEGAEAMADAIEAYDDHGAIEMYGFDALADHLATMGYRKTTTEREN